MTVFHDFETQSEADLTKVGSWAYSEHPSTDVICLCWAWDDGLIGEWVPARFFGGTDDCPESLLEAIQTNGEFEAHSVAFEIGIWQNIMVKRYGWPEISLDRYRDSMAVASYYALPAALDRLARVVGLEGKDPEGARLITKYSKLHLKTARREIPPEDVLKFVKYCRGDVEQERGIGDFLGELPDPELVIFQHDLKVNMRGLYLDQPGIAVATNVADQRGGDLEDEFRELTGLNPTQRDKIMRWVSDHGVELENLQAEYLEELLNDGDLPQGDVRDAIGIRVRYNKASTKKLDAMARQCGRDGRARFQTRYHGAITGRNTGTGFQPLNLNRGFDFEDMEPEYLVANIMLNNPAYLDMVYGDAMDAIGKASRHWIMAEEGSRILAGDFVSIEAVGLAVLAGEEWKVEAFRRGDPIYELTACEVHKLPPEARELALADKKEFKKKYPSERKDGKTLELACGYQGALGAWLKFDDSGRHSDEQILEYVQGWRMMHRDTRELWSNLQEAAHLVAWDHTKIASYRDIGFEYVDGWLTMILPNGKRLWYRDPQMVKRWPAWHKPATEEECATGECGHTKTHQLTYMSWKNKQWHRVSTYGGKLTENAVQATCRELLKQAELRVEAAGYPVVFSVYDEVVCEVPNGWGSKEEFQGLLEILPDFARDWPVRAEVWEGMRYRK